MGTMEIMYARRMLGKSNADAIYEKEASEKDIAKYKKKAKLTDEEFEKEFLWFVEYGYGIKG